MSSSRGFLGAGDVYAQFYDPTMAAFGPWEGPFESKKFEIKVDSDIKDMTSRGKNTYGQVVETVTIPKPNEFSLEFTEVNHRSMGTALAGKITSFSQSAGTITDQAGVAHLDKFIDLGKQNLASAGFTVKDDTGTITYVLDTDYTVNWRMGWVKPLSTGAITEAEALKISGTYNAVDASLVKGATESQIRARFKFDGINFADQLPVIVTVEEAAIAAKSAFDFLQDDFATIPLEGRLKTPAGKDAPFTVQLNKTA